MLNALILENFKAFGERQVIPFAPITLIFGANSAGKSSILQALLLLKQTLDEGEDRGSVLLPTGKLTDLGGFRDLVFRHDLDATCEITPLINADRALAASLFWGHEEAVEDLPGRLGIGIRARYDRGMGKIVPASLPVYFDSPEAAYHFEPVEASLIRDRMKDRPSSADFLDVSPFATIKFAISEAVQDLADLTFSTADAPIWVDPATYRNTFFVSPGGIAEENPSWQQSFEEMQRRIPEELRRWLDILGKHADDPSMTKVMRDLSSHYADYDQRTFLADVRLLNDYFCPLRGFLPSEMFGNHRSRTQDLVLDRVFGDFEGLSRLLVQKLPKLGIGLGRHLRHHLDRLVYLGPLRAYPERDYLVRGTAAHGLEPTGRRFADVLFRRPELVERTNEVLAAFGIGYRLRLTQVAGADGDEVYTLRLVDEATNTEVSLRDVGFGVSQVLPIIVQSLLSERNLALIEQPETHLHPRLQAELGSLFAEAAAAPRENQFIIETHSEHLVLRLQRLVRQGQLKPSDLSIVYVMHGEQGSQCVPLRLDAEGDFIDAWPEGFFEEGYREVFDLP